MNPNLQKIGKNFFTRSLITDAVVYGEHVETIQGIPWREWNPFRSKLAAALCSGLNELPIRVEDRVLYLGSAEGTTVSHVSDLVGENGVVVGVDVSPKAMAVFSKLAEKRENLVPMLGDANDVDKMKEELGDFSADVIVQDVSQKNQADIFVKNMRGLGGRSAEGLLVIKARSVDFTKPPEQVMKKELALVKRHLRIVQVVDLNRFESDHYLIHARQS